jgi:hypothetical protein
VKIEEIEAQIAELHARLAPLRADAEKAQEVLDQAREQIGACRTSEKTQVKESDEFRRKITAVEDELRRIDARLVEERRRAYGGYVQDVWRRLLDMDAKEHEHREARSERRRLEDQRHKDPKVADLWEAREEWKRIVDSSVPTLVRAEATRQLEKVEGQIDQLFPKALSVSGTDGVIEDICEIFYECVPGEKTIWLGLPVLPSIWDQPADGQSTAAEDLAIHMVWAFARAFPPCQKQSRVSRGDWCWRFALNGLMDEIRDADPVVMELPGGGRASFLFSELPSELRGIISGKDTDS